MAVLEKTKLFNSFRLDSRIHSANTENKEKWLGYFVGPMGAAFLNATLMSYLNMFYTDVLDLGNAYVWSAAFLTLFPVISKIVDAITNIIMGQMIDRTKTRQGKARPWILISAPFVSIFYILLFLIPKQHSIVQFVLVALSYNIFYAFALTIYNMSHMLMVPLSTSNVRQRDGLTLFANMGTSMIPGTIVSLLFPAVLLPLLGADYNKWVMTMTIMGVVALPLMLVEYFYTKERVTEAAVNAGEEQKTPLREQFQICISSKYWIMLIIFVFIYMLMSNVNAMSIPYFCNWVLGTYNDGVTQMILSAVGKFPLGVGVFFLWPLVKKFGKRKVMIVGFFIAAAAEAFCWMFSHSLVMMLVGSFIYAIGFLPSYVYNALMADTLDYIECEKRVRVDGLTASILTIVGTVSTGLGQGFFNMGLTTNGYEAPYFVRDGVYNVQNVATQNFISFAYIGIPMISLMILAIIMIFFNVEKHLPRVHSELTARRKAEAEARGEVYISPEDKAALEQEENDRIAEENRIAELKEKCKKKGLDFETENQKYLDKQAKTRRNNK